MTRLGEFALRNFGGEERGGNERRADTRPEAAQRAYMIFMSVRDEDGLKAVTDIKEKLRIRHHQIDARR